MNRSPGAGVVAAAVGVGTEVGVGVGASVGVGLQSSAWAAGRSSTASVVTSAVGHWFSARATGHAPMPAAMASSATASPTVASSPRVRRDVVGHARISGWDWILGFPHKTLRRRLRNRSLGPGENPGFSANCHRRRRGDRVRCHLRSRRCRCRSRACARRTPWRLTSSRCSLTKRVRPTHCSGRTADGDRSSSSFKSRGDSTQLPRGEQGTQGCSHGCATDEALSHEVAKQGVVARSDQGMRPKPQVEQRGIYRGRGKKGRGRNVRERANAPTWIQEASGERGALAAVQHEPLGCLTLNDQVGVLGRIKAARQLGDNVSRDVERQACADLVQPARQLALQEIRLDERYVRRVSEPTHKVAEEARIDLVGHDTSAALGEWLG